jgi:hypothetical protein
MERHDRQSRLREVGPDGQARLARACTDVPLDGFAAEIAVRYLAGAGVGRLRVGGAELALTARAIDAAVHVEVVPALAGARGADEAAGALGLRDPTARQAAGGALAALRAIRRVLDGAETSS